MRHLFAALALAGALMSFVSPALAWGGMARSVLESKRCAPPFGGRGCGGARASIIALVESVGIAERVPVGIGRALVKVESGFNPHARNGSSLGLTQIKCATARGLGFRGDCAALFDPAVNLTWGLRHARLALARGSIGFHQSGLHARRVSAAYVARINAAMR